MSGNTNTEVLLAGAVAAFTVDLLVYPLDTLKTRIQSKDYKKRFYNQAQNAVDKKALLRGLYQGVGTIILVTIPSSGVFFTTYEAVKHGALKLTYTDASGSTIPRPLIDGAASSIAELASCAVLTPFEVIKQNAQMVDKSKTKKGSWRDSPTMKAFKEFKQPRQLFRGYTALAARNLPFTAMQFPMYEHLKRLGHDYRKKNGTATGSLKETATITAVSAGAAGSLAAFITTPVDVVKTRIMLSAASDGAETTEAALQDKATQALRQKSGVAVGKEILAENGVKGLFRGAGLRAVWTALGSGLYLGVYESGRIWLGERRTGKKELHEP